MTFQKPFLPQPGHQPKNQTQHSDELLLAPPSPQLEKRMLAEMQELRKQLVNTVLHNRVKAGRGYRPVGFNDGLIYPGDLFPVGTGAETARKAAAQRTSLKGQVNVIVLLIDFNDKPMEQDKAHFEELFFSRGVVPTGSVRDYFLEVSNGKVDIAGEVAGPYRMPQTYAAYNNGNSGIGSAVPNARTMARDAAIAANPNIDFSQYDNDGDGFVDAFILIHAGTGGEMTGSPNDMWSHKWVLEGGAYPTDGSTNIYAYLTVPEDCRLGVCAHELGHLLFGFPDLYDSDYSSGGIGDWCLMAGGSWNNDGLTPAHPSAWCKMQQNWVETVTPVTNQKSVRLADVKTGFQIYKLWKNGLPDREYFLVEYRQKEGYDEFLPESGLLIWHVDEAVNNNTNERHYLVALMQADGQRDLENNRNRGDAGDCFTGSANNSTFDRSSNPGSLSYAGSDTCVSLTNIDIANGQASFDLTVNCAYETIALISSLKSGSDPAIL